MCLCGYFGETDEITRIESYIWGLKTRLMHVSLVCSDRIRLSDQKEIYMSAIHYIKRKIGQTYLVWIGNSNSYVQLEEPAWFVFRKIAGRHKSETIASEFAWRYDIASEESLSFVKDIRSEIMKMNQTDSSDDKRNKNTANLNDYKFTPFSIHCYNLGNKQLAFAYESRLFEYYLHPLISQFETTEPDAEIPLFELFAHQERIVFRYNGEVKGIWENDETQLVKGLIFLFLINVMHDKIEADWLMTVHASAITNGKKTILFSAAPGMGKTTMAALLKAKGYRLISDDFVPIDRNDFCAYPFPIAMSVKPGSMDCLIPFYPELELNELVHISPEKSVRYIPMNAVSDFTKEVFPVQEIVFIEYNQSVDFTFEKLNGVKSLKQLLDQAWVPSTPGNADILFNRIMETSFYKLTYSNNTKALQAISSLFDEG